MDDFKGRHFEGQIILWAVRWCCKYRVSDRELEEMLAERGVLVDHATIHRWTQHYAPEIERRLRWHWRRPRSTRWRVDETDVKVRGRWAYLCRALDKRGDTIDLHLSPTRNAKAAKRLLAEALRGLRASERPKVTNTDKAATCGAAIATLKKEGKLGPDTQQRQDQYLNNRIGSDHGKLKRLIRPTLGFQSLRTAFATMRGFEVVQGAGAHFCYASLSAYGRRFPLRRSPLSG
jgi:transposase-like protein